MNKAEKEQDWQSKFEELLNLSLSVCQSLREKYPVRLTWTPEFTTWEKYIKQEGTQRTQKTGQGTQIDQLSTYKVP
jgi:hypothetical protein